jgi:hypothetical protein
MVTIQNPNSHRGNRRRQVNRVEKHAERLEQLLEDNDLEDKTPGKEIDQNFPINNEATIKPACGFRARVAASTVFSMAWPCGLSPETSRGA